MKGIFRAILLALTVMPSVLVSCTDNLSADRPATQDCLKINSVSTAPVRAAIRGTSFPSDKDNSIGVFTYSKSSGWSNRNVRFTCKAGQTQWTSEKGITLTKDPVTVYAYYPWQEDVTAESLTVTSSINGDDWMRAAPVGNVSSSNPSIDLTMDHVLSLVDLVFNVSSQYAEGTQMTSLTISSEGAALSGTADLLTGEVSGNGPMTGGNALSAKISLPLKDGVIRTECLLVPYGQSPTGRYPMTISCTFGGQTFNASIPESMGVAICSGVRSIVSLSINVNKMTVESAQIVLEEGETAPFVEETDDPAADYVSGNLDCSLLKQLKHPRLFLTADGLEGLKRKVTVERFENKELYKINKMVLDLADDCLSAPPIEYKFEGKSILGQSREALKHLFACSYAFKITGRPKYLDKAREDLATVCAFNDWHPAHWLDVGEMALGVAIAYDWLYYSLSLEERTLIHRKLVDYCLDEENKTFKKTIGNWNQVCYCGILAAALALYEKDKTICGKSISELLANNKYAMEGIYGPDGNYSEGYDYWGYGTGFQVMILKMLQTAFGTMFGLDKVEGFSKTADYMLFMAGSCGKCFPYADGGTATERSNYAMWWFASYRNDPSLLFNEMRLLRTGFYPGSQIRTLPLLPILAKDIDNLDAIASVKPSGQIWSGNGNKPVVMVHTKWTFDADDAYLGLAGGYASTSHGHLDAGSFVYDALGYRWSDDYVRPDYTEMEPLLAKVGGDLWNLKQSSLRWDVFKINNLSHSTLSVMNGGGSGKVHASDHLVGSSGSKVTIVTTYTSPDELGGRINMTAAVSDGLKSAIRTVKLIDGVTLVVTDELTALSYRAADIQWRMNTPASVSVGSSEIVLTQGGKSMSLTTASNNQNVTPILKDFGRSRPSNWTQREWDTSLTNNIVGFSATIPAGKSVTLTTTITPKN